MVAGSKQIVTGSLLLSPAPTSIGVSHVRGRIDEYIACVCRCYFLIVIASWWQNEHFMSVID